eukprot:471744-Amorphochlora_amoeboformis.AAC.2
MDGAEEGSSSALAVKFESFNIRACIQVLQPYERIFRMLLVVGGEQASNSEKLWMFGGFGEKKKTYGDLQSFDP